MLKLQIPGINVESVRLKYRRVSEGVIHKLRHEKIEDFTLFPPEISSRIENRHGLTLDPLKSEMYFM